MERFKEFLVAWLVFTIAIIAIMTFVGLLAFTTYYIYTLSSWCGVLVAFVLAFTGVLGWKASGDIV